MADDFGIDNNLNNNLKNKGMNFHNLVTAIQQVHKHLSAQAEKLLTELARELTKMNVSNCNRDSSIAIFSSTEPIHR